MIKNYMLSVKAREDIYYILDYTAQNFGKTQAKQYYQSLELAFKTLIDNPTIGRLANNIKPNLRRFIHRKHIIFYIVENNNVRVSRVIHHKEDSENYFL